MAAGVPFRGSIIKKEKAVEDGRIGTRTPDILGVNEALYRLSYSPDSTDYAIKIARSGVFVNG
jgi:hypothetical protein